MFTLEQIDFYFDNPLELLKKKDLSEEKMPKIILFFETMEIVYELAKQKGYEPKKIVN